MVQRGKPQPIDDLIGVYRYSHPASPPRDTPQVFSLHNCYLSMTTIIGGRTLVPLPGRRGCNFFLLEAARQTGKEITLSGGSLGSCVDEERSQLRELM